MTYRPPSRASGIRAGIVSSLFLSWKTACRRRSVPASCRSFIAFPTMWSQQTLTTPRLGPHDTQKLSSYQTEEQLRQYGCERIGCCPGYSSRKLTSTEAATATGIALPTSRNRPTPASDHYFRLDLFCRARPMVSKAAAFAFVGVDRWKVGKVYSGDAEFSVCEAAGCSARQAASEPH